MSRGKRTKKKSSQTNCEISSQEMDSHGTTTNHGQNPATTECTCFSKSQKRKMFLLCCVVTETPYCSIHTIEGSDVIQKTKPRKAEKGTSKQPSLIRRFGRWLIKKVTKGKKEENIPNKPTESISATVCISPDEPPSLQMLCQQVLSVVGLEETTQANKADDISVASESAIVAVATVGVDVHRKFSEKELCRTKFTIGDDKNTSNTDSKQNIAYDEEQNKESETKPDTCDINPEYDQHTVMTLKKMCKAAVTYTDDTKIDQTDDKEQVEVNESEPDNKGISPECDNSRVSSLTELCTKAIGNANDRTPIEIENNDKANAAEPDTKDIIPECDTNNVMSLKEMCTATVRTADGMTTSINDIENDEANDAKEATTDKTPECKKTMTFSLNELCSTAIRNADNLTKGVNDTTEERVHNKELDEANENKPTIIEKTLECDKYAAKALKELCSAAIRIVNDMKTSVDVTELDLTSDKDKKVSNNSEPSGYDINPKYDNASVQSLKGMCLEAIENADDVKTGIKDTPEDQTGEKELKAVNDNTDENSEITHECDRNQSKSLTEVCTVAIGNADNIKISIYDTEQDHAYDQEGSDESAQSSYALNPKPNNASALSLKELCLEAIENVDDLYYDTEQEQAFDKDQENPNETAPSSYDINPKSDTVSAQSLKELCLKAIENADDVNTGISDTLEDQTGDKDNTEENNVINPEYNKNQARSLAKLWTAAIRNADVKTGISDIEIDQDYRKKQDEEYDTDESRKQTISSAMDNVNEPKQSHSNDLEYQKQTNEGDVEKADKADLDHGDGIQSQELINNTDKDKTYEITQDHGYDVESEKHVADDNDAKTYKAEHTRDNDKEVKSQTYDIDVNTDIEAKHSHGDEVEGLINNTDMANESKQGNGDEADGLAINTGQANDLTQRYGHDDIDQDTTKDINMDSANIAEQEYDHDIEGQKKINAINMDTTEETNQCHYDDKESQMNANYIDIDKAIETKEGYSDEKDDHQLAYDTDLDKAYEARQGNADAFEGKKQINDIDETKATEAKLDHYTGLGDVEQTKSTNIDIAIEEAIHGHVNHVKRQEQTLDTNIDYSNETKQYHIYDGGQVETKTTYNDMANKSKHIHDIDIEKKDLSNNTDINKADRTQQAQIDYTNLERTNESNKAEDHPNGSDQIHATYTVANMGSNIKQNRATVNMNKATDTADTKADDVEKDNKNNMKKESATETAHTTENGHQDVNAELFLPVETLFQLMLDVHNERRFKTRKKHRNKVTMQCEINYMINMDQGTSNDGVEEDTDKEHMPQNITKENIRKREEYKTRQVDSKHGGNDNTDSDIDANKSRIPTAEIGVGAKAKKRNLANENMIQAALKKMQDEAAIQPDGVPRSKAATNIAASEAVGHVERHLGAEAKPYTGGEHESKPKPEPKPETNPDPKPKLLSESHTEQNKDTTPCIDTGSSNTQISHGTYRKRKQKRKKAKWY